MLATDVTKSAQVGAIIHFRLPGRGKVFIIIIMYFMTITINGFSVHVIGTYMHAETKLFCLWIWFLILSLPQRSPKTK